MPRPTASLASALASVLQAAATAGCPAWVTPEAWGALVTAVGLLTRDARARAVTGKREEAADALGVRRSTLDVWTRRGWLSGGSGR